MAARQQFMLLLFIGARKSRASYAAGKACLKDETERQRDREISDELGEWAWEFVWGHK
ncbi:hypothetical protein Ancab_006652, partial [Ancistrocladus abbreviatus]